LFVHRLALALGKTRGQLLREVEDGEEIFDWMAFEQVQGLPDPFVFNAMQCALIFNANRGKDSRVAKVEDYLPAVRKWQYVDRTGMSRHMHMRAMAQVK
jgi:hypothetical protein